jgi:hypothetical protein
MANRVIYICPLEKDNGIAIDHPIPHSRLKQHIKLHHRHLVANGETVENLVLKIKTRTAEVHNEQ